MQGAPVFDLVDAKILCVACQDGTHAYDRATNLCRDCWRAWRFGSRG
jgi:hypothetical protein